MCPCLQPIKEGTGSWRRKHLSSDGWLATKLLIVGCNLSPAPECVKYFTFRKTFSRLPGEAFLQSTPGFGERRRNVLPPPRRRFLSRCAATFGEWGRRLPRPSGA